MKILYIGDRKLNEEQIESLQHIYGKNSVIEQKNVNLDPIINNKKSLSRLFFGWEVIAGHFDPQQLQLLLTFINSFDDPNSLDQIMPKQVIMPESGLIDRAEPGDIPKFEEKHLGWYKYTKVSFTKIRMDRTPY